MLCIIWGIMNIENNSQHINAEPHEPLPLLKQNDISEKFKNITFKAIKTSNLSGISGSIRKAYLSFRYVKLAEEDDKSIYVKVNKLADTFNISSSKLKKIVKENPESTNVKNRFVSLNIINLKIKEEFIHKAQLNIKSIPIKDLIKGFQNAICDQNNKDPQTKTTLFVVAEEIAQFFINKGLFGKAIEIRMMAAQKLSPGSPLNTLQKTLENADQQLGAKLYPLDTSLFKNNSLSIQQRQFQDKSSSLRSEIHLEAKLNHHTHEQMKKTVGMISKNPKKFNELLPKDFCKEISIKYGERDIYQRRENTGDKLFSSDEYLEISSTSTITRIHFEGVGDIRLWDMGDKPGKILSHSNRICIDLDPNITSIEATAKLHILLSALGLGAVSSSTRPVDEERIKIMQLFRIFYPKQAYTFERDAKSFENSIENLKNDICKSVPEMQNKFKNNLKDMYQQEIYPGQFIWAVKGLADKVKEKGGIGIMAGVAGSITACFNAIVSMLKFGCLSSQDRFQLGIITEGSTSQEDFRLGGAEAVFSRLIGDKMPMDPNEYHLHGHVQILYDLKLVERGGYVHPLDKYGMKCGNDYSDRGSILDLAENPSISNEVCIRDRVPPQYIKGLLVSNEEKKKMLIKVLVENGVINDQDKLINGIPVDEFIHVGNFEKKYWD